jgi:plastocyanin
VLRVMAAAGLIVLALVACDAEQGGTRTRSAPEEATRAAPGAPTPRPARSERVDPRKGGVEVGLGEWAVTPEAPSLRPGPVTFVVRNRGTIAHGFEIALEGDSSGSGSGDLFKAEGRLLQPGESDRIAMSLAPGVYKFECLVDGHDDLGMEGSLEVRTDAPLVEVAPQRSGAVAIEDFAFSPGTVEVEAGSKVTWRNGDPTEHTVTAVDGSFDSDALGTGDSFSIRFDRPGVYRYRCAIHPEMKGLARAR